MEVFDDTGKSIGITGNTGPDDRGLETVMQGAIKRLKDWQPGAYSIRVEGNCPDCGAPCEVSYLLSGFARVRSNGEEDCGYYCECCGWGNGGSRDVLDEDGGLG